MVFKAKNKKVALHLARQGKRLGEIAEVLFSLEVLRRGGVASLPLGDTASFDMVVTSVTGSHKVQIKSSWVNVLGRRGNRIKDRCRVTIGNGNRNKKAYSNQEADAMAIWLEPFKRWMILPIEKLRGRVTIHVYRHQCDTEGWNFLGLVE